MTLPSKLFNARGFTIIELLLALALGLTLSGAITKIYLQNNSSMRQDEQIARLQENARYALKLLAREIAMAGFAAGTPDQTGLTPGSVSTGCAADTWSMDLTIPLDFINDAAPKSTHTTKGGTSITCSTPDDLVDDSDIISIKRTADRPTSENGVLSNNVGSVDNQWYLRLADSRSDKSWVYVANGAGINSTDLTANSGVDYWAYFHKIYYLRNIKDTGVEVPTLCAQILQGSALTEECFVEGIEDIQIELGIDSDQDTTPDFFRSNPSASEMPDAVVVRIYILARSLDEITGYTNNKTYYLGSKSFANPNDGYFRRVYSTTVQIRNARLPNA